MKKYSIMFFVLLFVILTSCSTTQVFKYAEVKDKRESPIENLEVNVKKNPNTNFIFPVFRTMFRGQALDVPIK